MLNIVINIYENTVLILNGTGDKFVMSHLMYSNKIYFLSKINDI